MSTRSPETHESSTVHGRIPRRPQDTLLADLDLPLTDTFYPLGYPVRIFTNSLDVLLAAFDTFGHAKEAHPGEPLTIRIGVSQGSSSSCPPEPARREYNHLYSLVADGENQALLDLQRCVSFTWVTESAVRNRLYFRYNFLEKVVYLLLGSSVVTDLHAACISKNRRGVLLCGDSGAGKSTLAYASARAGWTYTSDDTSYLINDSHPPRVIGHSHRARFRPQAKLLFPELNSFEIAPRMEGKPSLEVPIADLPIASTTPEVEVAFIVNLNRASPGMGRLIKLPEGSGSKRFCSELFSAGEIRAMHEQKLEALWTVPTFELQYQSTEEAIEILDLLLGSS
ncbi:MAG: aldolase [Acidobacteria bacterium]|nr:aldolase [Acidobacteriota bacterium]